MSDQYINAAHPPRPVSLASGRVLAPGDRSEIDVKDPHDKALRDSGALLKADHQKKEG